MKFGRVDDPKMIFELPDLELIGAAKKGAIRIGCSLWTDDTFIGTYYPPKTPKKNMLQAYAETFSCVEVNSTRFGTPRVSTLEQWRDKTHGAFKFCVKVPQVVSHRKDMLDPSALSKFEDYVQVMNDWGPNCGRSYMVLPNYFNDLEMLSTFLSYVPKSFDLSVECRDPDLVHSNAFSDLLYGAGVSQVVTDTPGRQDVLHGRVINGRLLVRFVGANLHATDYERMDLWAVRLQELYDAGVDVYFFMHQHEPFRYHAGDLVVYLTNKLKAMGVDMDEAPKQWHSVD